MMEIGLKRKKVLNIKKQWPYTKHETKTENSPRGMQIV